MITQKDLDHVAHLGRLDLSEQEIVAAYDLLKKANDLKGSGAKPPVPPPAGRWGDSGVACTQTRHNSSAHPRSGWAFLVEHVPDIEAGLPHS